MSLKTIRPLFRIAFIILFIALTQNGAGQTTTVLSEGFEGGAFPPAGWANLQGGSGNMWAVQSYGITHTGSYAAECIYNATFPANAWLISPGLSLTGGITYTLSYYEATSSSFPENLKVTVGTVQSIVGQTTVLQTLSSIVNSAYVKQTITYTPGASGTYYFGFNCNSLANEYFLDIDDVLITTPCASPSQQATALITSSITSGTMTTGWTRGNGNDVMVIAKAGSPPTVPSGGTAYAANSVFGSGSSVGGGYCVYNGTGASVNLTGLTASTPYYFAVYEYNTAGNCYDLTALTGNASTLCVVAPAAPTSTAGTSATTNSFNANWTASATAATYFLDVCTDAGFTAFVSGYNNLNTGNVTTYNVTGLSIGVTYYYRERASNSCGTSLSSGTITIATVCAAPTIQASALNWSSITGISMTTSWTRGNGNNVMVIANAGSAPSAPIDGTAYTANAVYGSGAPVGGGFCIYNGTGTSVSLTGLSPITTYYFAVYEYAILNTCYNLISLTGTMGTSCTVAPAIPASSAATGAGPNSFTANWTASASATAYYLDVCTDAGFTAFVSGYNNLNVGNITSYLVSGLSVVTTYYYRIRAQNTCGTSLSSGTISVVTTSCAPTYAAGTSGGDYISLVHIPGTTLNNVTAGAASPYWTVYPASGSTTATLMQGSNYTLTVKGGTYTTAYISAWIDYNNDGIFNSTNEFIGQSPNCGSSTTVNLTTSLLIPLTSALGPLKLRLREIDLTPGPSSVQACGAASSSYGEAEDYLVTIIAETPPNCATAVSPANAASGLCINQTLNWAAAGSGSVPSGYKLFFGTDNPPTNIVNGTNLGLVYSSAPVLAVNTTYYWKVVPTNTAGDAITCAVSSFTTGSNAVPAAASVITGTSPVCQGQNGVAYSVGTIAGAASYAWSYSGTGASIVGSGTAITINYSASATSGILSVYGVNGTCNGASNALSIVVNPLPLAPVSISGTGIISNAFDANWNPGTNATGYYLDVATSVSFTGDYISGFNNQNVGNVLTSHVTGLSASTSYYYQIRAYNACGTSANSAVQFVKTSAIQPGLCFGTATNYTVGLYPVSIATADFNGDTKADLVVANNNSNTISVLLGTGTGTFGVAATYGVGSIPYSVIYGDFNGDGKTDLAVANSGSNTVSILTGTGTGTFGVATNFPTGLNPYSVTTADFNGDGKADLAIANYGSNNVSLLLGTGTGSFGAGTTFAVGISPTTLITADFNGDGKADLAVANYGSNTISVLLGSGAGSFGLATNFSVGANPFSLISADFNGDTKADLAVANYGSNNTSVLLGTGSGSFGAATNFPGIGAYPTSIISADFNSDGKVDLASAPQTAEILIGTGIGSFSPAGSFDVKDVPFAIVSADFNGDGKPDLATCGGSSVSILLNSASPAAPAPVLPGVISVCNGSNINLNGTSAGNSIYWYTVPTGGSNIGVSASGVNFSVSVGGTTTYYAETQTTNGCASSGRSPSGLVTATPAGTYAILPYSTSFESVWLTDACNGGASRIPDVHWASSIGGSSPNNNDFWHRDDYVGVDWTTPGGGQLPILASNGTYSARFHNDLAAASSTGALDLYVDLSPAGTKTLLFDYINNQLPVLPFSFNVLLSTDGGATFPTTLKTINTQSAGWTTQTVTTAATSATSVLRFIVTDKGAQDVGIDNLSLTAPCTPPSVQASAFSSSAITSASMTIGWTRGNGTNVMVIARAGFVPTAPSSGTSYAGNSVYGSGTAVGGGFCVYNGSGTSVNLTSLTAATAYYFDVYEYNATGNCYDLTALAANATTSCLTIPSVPSSTPATAISTNSFIANWTVAAGATSYYLDVVTNIGFTVFVAGFNNLSVGNVNTFNVGGLTLGVTYYYRIRASNSCGTSVSSATITVTTTSCSPTYASGTGSGDYISLVQIPGTTLNSTSVGATTPFWTVYPGSGSTTASLIQGATYTLTVKGGTYINGYEAAWIDYNNDGFFNSTNEFLGQSPNCGSSVTVNLTTTWLIPASSFVGTVKLRIRHSDTAPGPAAIDACGVTNSSYGETEDYVITILAAPTISTSAIASSSFCVGDAVSVPYTITGSFATGNIFTAQLSDASGSFASPTTIGTLSSTTAGTISASMPGGASGTGYRIRVISSNPAVTGSNNGTNLTINLNGTFSSAVSASRCGMGTLSIGANTFGTNNWYASLTGGSSLDTGYLFTTPSISATTIYYVDATNSGCTSSPRHPVTASVNLLPVANAGTNQIICASQAVVIGGSPTASAGTFPYTYTWTPSLNLSLASIANPIATAPITRVYNLTVNDANNCTATSSITLTVPATGGAGTWTWTGASTNWFDACNWDKKCLPDGLSDVIIPGGTPNNPMISGSSANCNTITIVTTNGGNLNINTSASGSLNVTQ